MTGEHLVMGFPTLHHHLGLVTVSRHVGTLQMGHNQAQEGRNRRQTRQAFCEAD